MSKTARKKIEVAQSEVATKVFVAREYSLSRLLGNEGQCHGVGMGVTLTNLFGKKNSYKETLATSQDMIKEYAQEISSLKS